jgi:ADP-ribose pyrophosphatase YjhB (NUDIX family)
VDVRGALFDLTGRVLLVREQRDGRWTLPGGWADALDPPAVAVEREFAEEAGLAVRATRLVAVHDGSRRNAILSCARTASREGHRHDADAGVEDRHHGQCRAQ